MQKLDRIIHLKNWQVAPGQLKEGQGKSMDNSWIYVFFLFFFFFNLQPSFCEPCCLLTNTLTCVSANSCVVSTVTLFLCGAPLIKYALCHPQK